MKIEKIIDHMGLARDIAQRYSKDPSTKVGTLVLGEDGEPLVHAWNGFIRGADDSPELYADREYKYRHVIHAEMNAISNAARVGAKLKGAIWFVTECPCDKCIGPLLQTDPLAIYCQKPEGEFLARWGETIEFTIQQCARHNVPLIFVDRV